MSARAPRPLRTRRPRSVRGSLASIVLATEFVVVVLATLLVFGLRHVSPAVAFGGGGVLLVLILVALAATRSRVGIVLGWVVQVLFVLAGLIQLIVGIVGIVFALFWLYCMIVGGRIDRREAAG